MAWMSVQFLGTTKIPIYYPQTPIQACRKRNVLFQFLVSKMLTLTGLKDPPMNVEGLLAPLEHQRLPQTVSSLREYAELI